MMLQQAQVRWQSQARSRACICRFQHACMLKGAYGQASCWAAVIQELVNPKGVSWSEEIWSTVCWNPSIRLFSSSWDLQVPARSHGLCPRKRTAPYPGAWSVPPHWLGGWGWGWGFGVSVGSAGCGWQWDIAPCTRFATNIATGTPPLHPHNHQHQPEAIYCCLDPNPRPQPQPQPQPPSHTHTSASGSSCAKWPSNK